MIVTIRQETMPSEIWRKSNFPERTNHVVKEITKVRINGVKDLSFPSEVDGVVFDGSCRPGIRSPLLCLDNRFSFLLFKMVLRFPCEQIPQPNEQAGIML